MNKLEELIASLDLHDRKAFKKVLLSPYFGSGKAVEKLFEEMAEGRKPADSNRKITPEQRYLQTDLTRLLEEFIALRYLNRQSFTGDILKMQALASRDCYKSWHYHFTEFSKNKSLQNADYHHAGFLASETQVSYEYKMQSRKKQPNFSDVMFHLDVYYLSKKLQLCCEIINHRNLFGGHYELNFIDEIKTMALHFEKTPAVKIYHLILLNLTEPENINHFTATRNYLQSNSKFFPAKELNEIFFYIKNYCIRKINQGDTSFYLTLFEIYKDILTNKPLMKLDYMSQFEFKNIVSLSLRLKEFVWCRNFITKYINYLHPDERKNANTYNQAYLHFVTGNFKDAIRLLSEVEFTDVVYQLDSRVVLLKCYYELSDFDAFYYHASAFRLFLLRNRHLSDYQKTINRNLIKYLTGLTRNLYRPSKIKKLKEDLMKEKKVADLQWLLEQYERG